MPFISQLEPDALLTAFMDEPPIGFTVARSPQGMPGFTAPFDLLTTADDALRRRVAAGAALAPAADLAYPFRREHRDRVRAAAPRRVARRIGEGLEGRLGARVQAAHREGHRAGFAAARRRRERPCPRLRRRLRGA